MSKKFFLLILSLSLLSCAQIKYTRQDAEVNTSLAGIKAQIDSILTDSLLNQAQVGVKIVSLNSGEILYEKDSQKLFAPASNMKLLTTATALKELGPNFEF